MIEVTNSHETKDAPKSKRLAKQKEKVAAQELSSLRKTLKETTLSVGTEHLSCSKGSEVMDKEDAEMKKSRKTE